MRELGQLIALVVIAAFTVHGYLSTKPQKPLDPWDVM